MENKSFVKILRKVIREEVKTAIREVLNEQKPNHKQVINHGMDLHKMVERQTNPYKIKAKKKKTYTKNSMLNDLLNETATMADFSSMNQAPSVSEMEPYPAMTYDSSKAESFSTQMRPQQLLATTDTNGNPVDMSNETVAKTVGMMTKDYSSLMKAIDKKKGIK